MKTEFIAIDELCRHYEVDRCLLIEMKEIGIIEVVSVSGSDCIRLEQVTKLEKTLRLQEDLNLNLEGIDVVFNLLQQIDDLNAELLELRNRLRLYEDKA
jgi:hypothetical protein